MSFSVESNSAAASAGPMAIGAGRERRVLPRVRALSLRSVRPELGLLAVLAGVLNLWALGRNGWANDYYSGAVRSMASSWHNFLYVSLDRGGVMTVDKPPLALWVQALSVRVFGYHSLSVLVPQALMGIASVALVYDLVRRRFGRAGGFLSGLALALTPITVAISRHNNPDALLVLCLVAALWFTVRALERGRTRELVLAGVCVGLGFETKMGVALTVLPGIVLAWLWCTPAARGRLHALRQLLGAGGAMLLVGGAWPALVQLTPAADRPWISGTSDNSIFSLIFEYNGVGRVDGQTGGPEGLGGGTVFGGSTGPLRLLNEALGGQAGWLLGFALVAGVGILVSSRLRPSDPRSGWLIAVGGAFVTTAVLFSAASGIFHPYYVSLLAPFVAAIVGAGAAALVGGELSARIIAPLAVAAGVAAELVVLGDYPSQLRWLVPVLIAVGVLAAVALALLAERRARIAALGAILATLLIAPGVWAFDTLGHRTSGTFPSGGPASVISASFGGGPGGGARRPGARGGAPFARGGFVPGGQGAQVPPGGSPESSTAAGGGSETGTRPLFGEGAAGASGANGSSPSFPGGTSGSAPGAPGGLPGIGGAGGPMGGQALATVLAYVKAHGGGTVAVASQSTAAAAIIAQDADVAGIGGFSGRESDVSVSWLAREVGSGKIRWVVGEQSPGAGFGGKLPGDTRVGAKRALSAVAAVCTKVALPSASSGSATNAGAGGESLYDCEDSAAALTSRAAQESDS